MADKLQGQTISFNRPPWIIGFGTVAGPEEEKGPLGDKFDLVYQDPKCGEQTWEKGENKMVKEAINQAMTKGSVAQSDLDLILGGDLLNQITTANFAAREFSVSFLGIYGACSTMVEGLALGSAMMDGGFADCVLAYCSSHYQTAERQYRTPIEYGAQYPPYKQWTVTGAGAYLLGWVNGIVAITAGTIGKVMDLGVKDSNDMGSAMAPAAADTILQHFTDMKRGPQDYDLIITGDLGHTGKKMLEILLQEKDITLGDKLQDSGALIFANKQNYGAGGSGCAASALVLGSMVIPGLVSGKLKKVLLIGTGALLSPLTVQQGESIPGIAHGVVLEKNPGGGA